MKRNYIFLALVLASSLVFAQSKIKQSAASNLSTVKITKEIDNTYNSTTAKAVVDSLHYDGADVSNAVGTNGAATFEAHAFFSAAQLAGHNANGNTITSVKIYINGVADVASTKLKFYSNQTTVVYSQVFTPIEGWNEVVLTTPFAIPTTDLYVGYECVATGGYPLGCDAGPTNSNGDWTVYSGTWYHLPALGATLTYNWHIRAMVDGTPLSTPVASCTPLVWNAGSVELTQSKTSGTFTLTNNGASTLTASGITGISAPFTTNFVPGSVSLTAGQSTTFTFSFDPTVLGAVNQTAVIATNGGNISIALNGTGIVCNKITTYPFSEGFEGAGFAPDCWTLNDVDGDTYNWRVSTASPHTGTKSAASDSYINGLGALNPDNYLITPQFEINASNLQLTYWVAAQDFDYPDDKYSVMVSTTGKNPADFTTVTTETLTDTTWAMRTVSLSAYNGQDVYIAFRHWGSTDWFNFKIDDILIDVTTGLNSVNDAATVGIFPNPSTGVFTVSAIDNNSTLEVYNIVGERMLSNKLVKGNNTINMSNMSVGTYFFKVTSNGEVTTKKVVLSK